MNIKKISAINFISYILILIWMLIAFTSSINNTILGYRICFLLLIIQIINRYKEGKFLIKKEDIFFIVWILGYAGLGALSSIWALNGEYAIATAKMLFYTAIGPIALLLFISDITKLQQVLNIILVASVYMMMCIILHLGDSIRSDVVIYNATSLYFNTVSQILAFLILIAYFLGKTTKKKYYYIYIIISYGIILYSGSRKSLLFPIIVICFTEIYSAKDLNKKFQKILLIVVLLLLVYTVVNSDELLYSRMQNLFSALGGDISADASTVERYYYRDLAISMFKERPILGYGMDNFQVKLMQLNYGHIAYSHNNWTEVASNLGLFGLVSYYWFYIYLLKLNYFSFRKKEYLAVFICVLIAVFMVFEYGIVSYGIQFYKVIFVIILAMTKLKNQCLNKKTIKEKDEKLSFKLTKGEKYDY